MKPAPFIAVLCGSPLSSAETMLQERGWTITYKAHYWAGETPDGQPWRLFSAAQANDIHRMAGYRFSKVIEIGTVHPEVSDFAKLRIVS